jgi:Mn2+/Fe2+ NRAMP family transporter
MASASVSTRATSSPPWETIVAVAALLAQGLWWVEVHTAFGLPAHPLLLHVPVVFVPILGLAVLAIAASNRLFERFLLPVAAFSVVTMAATILAAGAGEAFREDQERTMPPDRAMESTLQNHADAGDTLRLTMVVLTLALVAALFTKRNAAQIVHRVLIVLLAATAIFFVIRAGHLGSELVWSDPPR